MNHIPELIFKYKSVTSKKDIIRFYDIIKNNRIFFPTVYQLNDPFEGYLSGIYLSVAGSSISKKADEEHAIIKYCKEKYHVLALSEDCFSPQLWALYCENYSGICLCYKTSKAFRNIKRVEYKDQTEEDQFINNEDNPYQLIENRLLEKQKGWSYEHEWRIIEQDSDSYITYDPDELVGIIIGHEMDKETKEFVLSTIPSNLPVFRTYPGSNTGKIHLLDFYYEIPHDGSDPDFIKTVSQVNERIKKKSEKDDQL